MSHQSIQVFLQAIASDEISLLEQLIATVDHPAELVNGESTGEKPPILSARTVAMAARLADLGADLDRVSVWWAPGFGINPDVRPEVGRFLIERGAKATVHSLSALGLTDLLRDLLDGDPGSVHVPGGDGCRPLHFARDIATADLLIDRGAEIDALDTDHDSTPAQWLIGHSPLVARRLLDRGAKPDLFLATALGDRELVDRLIATDRSILGQWIGKPPWHSLGYQKGGGTIFQWTLGFNSFPHQVATRSGHPELFRYLFDQSDIRTQFLVACVTADRAVALSIGRANPGIAAGLDDFDRQLLARYCWETNVDLEAVRLMLDCGFPVDYPETAHLYSPLHNAAWGGFADLVELLLKRGHPVNVREPKYNSTPLTAAAHCALEDGRHPEGEYGRVVASLLKAGAFWEAKPYPTGHAAIDAALKRHLTAPLG